MEIIAAMYNKISGPDATNSYKLELCIDEAQREGVLNLAKKLKKGSELLLLVFETNTEEKEIKELINESPEQTKQRLNKRLHAMINDIAKEKSMTKEEIKTTLKKYLIQKKYIKESTKELTLSGFAAAIFYLQNEF